MALNNPKSKIENPRSSSEVIARLRSLADPGQLEGMARFGIGVENALGGIGVPVLRKLAREIGKNHRLAGELWKSGIHEARHLAAMIDEPERVTEAQAERWVKQFDSWDVCDGCCLNLFDKTPFAFRKALEWSRREEEFVKRAAFSLMAVLAVHDKHLTDGKFQKLLSIIKRESTDERNFVKKAVNWALRQTGKRNLRLNRAAIETAEEVRKIDSPSARWIATDALRELRSDAVQRRLGRLKTQALDLRSTWAGTTTANSVTSLAENPQHRGH